MPAAARQGDSIICGGEIGTIIGGSPNVFCNKLPLSRVGDPVICKKHGAQSIATGSSSVFANQKAVARVGDTCTCGAVILTGSPNVIVGG
jgi:uncharacterized Zn-binding protein involved in type VI secretion